MTSIFTQLCSSKTRDGQPCQRRVHAGQVVCIVHGGTLPPVKKKERERLQELFEPAVAAVMNELMSTPKTIKERALKLKAAQIVISRLVAKNVNLGLESLAEGFHDADRMSDEELLERYREQLAFAEQVTRQRRKYLEANNVIDLPPEPPSSGNGHDPERAKKELKLKALESEMAHLRSQLGEDDATLDP